jgi:hypothetical protein
MEKYKAKRIVEIKDFIANKKKNPCSAPIVKIVSNIEQVYDYLLRGAFIPETWVDDSKLTEFEIVPIDDTKVFVKRGYPGVQFHVASWETMQPSVSFFLNHIPPHEHHFIETLVYLSPFRLLNTRLPNTIMVEFVPPL